MKKYSDYKCIDFLENDAFVKDFSDGDHALWSKLAACGEIDIDEYVEAGRLVEVWQKAIPQVDDANIERLKTRISQTLVGRGDEGVRGRGDKGVRIALSIAAGIALLLGLFYAYTVINNPERHETDYSKYRVISEQQQPNEIVVITDTKELKISEDNPKVIYNTQGTLQVNNKVITEKPAKTTLKQAKAPVPNRLHVPYGKQAQLTFSDGSNLWVNSGTTVVYPETFIGRTREIYVNGEVYADIAPDAKKPFVIKTDDIEINVVGTQLNISAYSTDNFSRIVLVEGQVSVNRNENNLKLAPGQAFTATVDGNTLEMVDTEKYTSWKDGVYIFDGEPIETILLKLARYYNVTVLLPKEDSETEFFGKLELKDDFNAIIRNLSDIAAFNYAVKDNQYSIKYRTK